MRSFLLLRDTDAGFDEGNILTLQLSYRVGSEEGQKAINFFRAVEEKVRALPGVRAVAVSNGVPLLGASESGFRIKGRPPAEPGKQPMTVSFWTTPGHLDALGIRLLRGRFINEHDTEGAQPVAVIDEEFARMYFDGEEPVGQYFAGDPERGMPDYLIVGVVGHVKNYGLDSPGPVQAQMYRARAQVPVKFQPLLAAGVTLLVRTSQEPESLTASVRHAVQEVDPNQPVYNVQTMEKVVSDSIAPQRLSMMLLIIFAGVAVVLAAWESTA